MIEVLFIMAVLAAFLVSLAPSRWPQVLPMIRKLWRETEGVASVSYVWPTPGGSTGPVTSAPSTALAAQVNEVTALIQWVDADTLATVTHNFQLPLTYTFPYPNVAQFKPQVYPIYISFVTGPPVALYLASFGSNFNVIGKTSLANTAGTVLVWMRRPWQASQ
jgi:hypothetical protein